jgi:hypothetical protein
MLTASRFVVLSVEIVKLEKCFLTRTSHTRKYIRRFAMVHKDRRKRAWFLVPVYLSDEPRVVAWWRGERKLCGSETPNTRERVHRIRAPSTERKKNVSDMPSQPINWRASIAMRFTAPSPTVEGHWPKSVAAYVCGRLALGAAAVVDFGRHDYIAPSLFIGVGAFRCRGPLER